MELKEMHALPPYVIFLKQDDVNMFFNWLKKQKKEPPTSSRSPIKILTSENEEPKLFHGSLYGSGLHQSVQMNGGRGEMFDGVVSSPAEVPCGFVTGMPNSSNPSGNNGTGESLALLANLEVDELFRLKVLTSNSMEECMKIVKTKNLNCSLDELQDVLEKFIKEKSLKTFWN
jgi:hypothetical protein